MKKLISKVINLAKFTFEDTIYNKVEFYIKNKQFNDLRLLLDIEKDLLQAVSSIGKDDSYNIDENLNRINQMEDCVLDLYLEYEIV